MLLYGLLKIPSRPKVTIVSAAAEEIDGGLRVMLARDLDDSALDGRRFVVARDVIAADHVEDHVDTALLRDALYFLGEVLLPIIDRVIGANSDGFTTMVLPAASDGATFLVRISSG